MEFRSNTSIPTDFIWRRLHSFTGMGLTIFLFFHLLTNSQTALWFGDDGKTYIQSVNSIQDIPYFRIIEVLFLALPLAIHALWGLYYLKTGEWNSYYRSGKEPYLPEQRNRAYTWQRITSWILLFGVALHVIHMRFVEAPVLTEKGAYAVSLTTDSGLQPLAAKLNVALEVEGSQVDGNHVRAYAKDFGTAELLMVREAFKSPWMILFYTLFVLAACFHAFNGMWTFLITWGVTLSERSQQLFLRISTFLMLLTTFLGLSTIYLTYWVNLR